MHTEAICAVSRSAACCSDPFKGVLSTAVAYGTGRPMPVRSWLKHCVLSFQVLLSWQAAMMCLDMHCEGIELCCVLSSTACVLVFEPCGSGNYGGMPRVTFFLLLSTVFKQQCTEALTKLPLAPVLVLSLVLISRTPVGAH